MGSSKPYIFGLTEIDSQHQVIEDLLKELQAEVRWNTPGGTLWRVLDRLNDQLESHFEVEEAVLGLLSLSEATAHQAAHAEILCLIGMCQRRIEEEDAVPAEVAEWVSSIVELIHDHDEGFVHYLGVLRDSLAYPCGGVSAKEHKVDNDSRFPRDHRHGRLARDRRPAPAIPG